MKTSASQQVLKKTAPRNVLDDGAYHVHLHNKTTGQWFEIRDLVVTETMPQLIGTCRYLSVLITMCRPFGVEFADIRTKESVFYTLVCVESILGVMR